MIDTHRVSATWLALTAFMLAACAPVTSPPPVDPVKEQISVLQKQLLELQNNQNDIRRKVDEQSAIVQALSTKVKTLVDPSAGAPDHLQTHIRSADHARAEAGEKNGEEKENKARS